MTTFKNSWYLGSEVNFVARYSSGGSRLMHHGAGSLWHLGLIDDYGVVHMTLWLHVAVEQGLAHEAHSTDQTLVWLFVRVYEPVRITIVPRIECFAAHLKIETNFRYMRIGLEWKNLTSQRNGFSPVWMRLCFLKCSGYTNVALHSSHWYGLSPVCTDRMW